MIQIQVAPRGRGERVVPPILSQLPSRGITQRLCLELANALQLLKGLLPDEFRVVSMMTYVEGRLDLTSSS